MAKPKKPNAKFFKNLPAELVVYIAELEALAPIGQKALDDAKVKLVIPGELAKSRTDITIPFSLFMELSDPTKSATVTLSSDEPFSVGNDPASHAHNASVSGSATVQISTTQPHQIINARIGNTDPIELEFMNPIS